MKAAVTRHMKVVEVSTGATADRQVGFFIVQGPVVRRKYQSPVVQTNPLE